MNGAHISVTSPHFFLTFLTLLRIQPFSQLYADFQLSGHAVFTCQAASASRQDVAETRHHHLVASTAAISSCVSPPFNVRRTVHTTGNICPLHTLHMYIYTHSPHLTFSSFTSASQLFPQVSRNIHVDCWSFSLRARWTIWCKTSKQ